jgi:SAM-dependent methyltransferase/uncharacterized protein YbaR (Trm112 family)
MLLTTLPWLRCPSCDRELSVHETKAKKSNDIIFGTLICNECESTFPILNGVAVLVNDVASYLQFHVKGISALVKDSDIPEEYRSGYVAAKSEIETGFTEEDLESQRINALYYMNHYLSAKKVSPWWRPGKSFSPEIDRLVKNFWDNGPFAKIAEWTKKLKDQNVIELGCGVGGLARVLAKTADSYLGVDTAFASIALARHIYADAPYSLPIQIPQDLYNGPLSGKVAAAKQRKEKCAIDFVVGELERPPVQKAQFDLAIVLNAIDMIEDPAALPVLQYNLLKNDGVAIQGCPYIWQKSVAENLRKSLPKKIDSSSAAVEYLYEKSGFKIFKKEDHLPWLFLKHFRQIEMYSVHLFGARKVKL